MAFGFQNMERKLHMVLSQIFTVYFHHENLQKYYIDYPDILLEKLICIKIQNSFKDVSGNIQSSVSNTWHHFIRIYS